MLPDIQPHNGATDYQSKWYFSISLKNENRKAKKKCISSRSEE